MDAIDASLAAPADRLHRPLPAALRRSQHADRRDPRRARRPRPRRQGPLHRLFELPRVPARACARPQRGARLRALRLGAAALQPAVPRVRARDVPAVPRRRRRRDPVQPDRRRDAVGQARPVEAAGGRHAASRSATPARMYQDRYWHDNVFDTVDAAHQARRATRGSRCRRSRSRGCSRIRRSRRRSSARAGPSSSTRRSPPSTRHSTPTCSTA